MKGLIKFLTSLSGRAVRFVIGLAFIIWGVYFADTAPNWILIAIGIVPLSAGLFNFCILAPFLGYSFDGDKAQQQAEA